MAISIGDRLPDFAFKVFGKDGPAELTVSELCSGKKVVLFAVPGAFTPTCHLNHLPGYLEHLETIKSKGVDEIAVVSVNDVFVMNAWAQNTGGEGKITYLSDGSGDFAKAIGMDMDLSAGGLGIRSKRYSMIVDDGTVSALNIEDGPGQAVKSGAAAIIEQL